MIFFFLRKSRRLQERSDTEEICRSYKILISMYERMRAHIFMSMYVCMRRPIYKYACICSCMYICMYVLCRHVCIQGFFSDDTRRFGVPAPFFPIKEKIYL